MSFSITSISHKSISIHLHKHWLHKHLTPWANPNAFYNYYRAPIHVLNQEWTKEVLCLELGRLLPWSSNSSISSQHQFNLQQPCTSWATSAAMHQSTLSSPRQFHNQTSCHKSYNSINPRTTTKQLPTFSPCTF